MRGKRFLALILSVVLATSLTPMPAFADALVAGDILSRISSVDNPVSLSVGSTASGSVERIDEDWYAFTTSSRHSVYAVQVTSKTSDASIRYQLYDAYGSSLCNYSTTTTRTDKFLLTSSTDYKLKLYTAAKGGCSYAVTVTEIPSNPQYAPLGNDKNNPYRLTLSTPVNSQFDDRSGSQEQWYTFNTTGRHSAYAVKLVSRMNGQSVRCRLYDSYGDLIGDDSTTTVRTDYFLLTSDSTYTLKITSSYGAKSGFPSYEITATEVPSNPQYASLGKDKNNPYKLTIGKAASSQFDDRSGNQEQWFTFTTKSSNMPTFVTLASKSNSNSLRYYVYDTNGNQVASYYSTNTTRTDAFALKKSTRYVIRITGNYSGNSGYTSYQVKVAQSKPGAISTLKMKSKTAYSIATKWSNSGNSNQYQIAYKKSKAKKWTAKTTSNKHYNTYGLSKSTTYQFKVRGVYRINSTNYYGPWSKVLKVKTKAR